MMLFPGISLDNKQQKLVEILRSIVTAKITSKKRKSVILSVVSNLKNLVNRHKSLPKTNTNIYIYGGVGRGKTMIMRVFYEDLICQKMFIHYQDFMRMVHDFIHKMKGNNSRDVLVSVAKEISSKYEYICIDELEVNDIADAMIIGRLFAVLMEYGVSFAITSNKQPGELYKDGLQREQFVPFIEILKKQFILFPLDTSHDYRLDTIGSIEHRVIYPLSRDVSAQMFDVKNKLTNHCHYHPYVMEVFGRKLELPFVHKSVLVTSFDDLCRKNLSSNDFIAIAKHFSVIIMEDVPVIGEDETDVAIRFINFIDNVYFYKVLLFISLSKSPDEIYPKGRRFAEFQRTISRLHEINSHDYLLSAKGG